MVACLGAASNENTHTFKEGIILATISTIIFGLPMAYITKTKTKQ